MSAATYYVYILASRKHGTLYIGVTNDVRTRLEQHRSGRGSEFVKKYGVHRLVHVETFASPQEAIAREKQLKNWHRDWKTRQIEENNPDWSDLSHLLNSGAYGSRPSPGRRKSGSSHRRQQLVAARIRKKLSTALPLDRRTARRG